MADPPNHEKSNITPPDPAAAFENTNHEEPQDEDGSDREYLEKQDELSTHRNSVEAQGGVKEYMSISGDPSGHSSEGEIDQEKRPEIKQTKSYATTNSAITKTDSNVDHPVVKKPWYKKTNPLKWGATPPVPETRTPSREHTASFLSLVYFQWMAPMMDVSLLFGFAIPNCGANGI